MNKHMRRLLLSFAFIICHLSAVLAQTATSTYLPGVTPEGAIYLLPKTGIKVSVLVEKTTYTPGELCKYAERYLRIKDVSPTPHVSYRITDIRQEAFAVADTSKHYAIEFNAKTAATNVRLSDDGILCQSPPVYERGDFGSRQYSQDGGTDCPGHLRDP